MSKEFVRNIRNTTVNEPLATNEQNDIISDTNNIYIRNKNSYYPLTKSIQKIIATDTIVSVAENIDGTENNSVTLTTNIPVLEEFIKKFTLEPDINISFLDIKDLITTNNGIVKNFTDDTIEISTNYNIDDIKTQTDVNKENITVNTNKIQTLEYQPKIKILTLNNNYDDIFQELENETNSICILKYSGQNFFGTGKRNNMYYFFNIEKTTQTGFIDYQIIELTQTGANLFITSLTPSEVQSL